MHVGCFSWLHRPVFHHVVTLAGFLAWRSCDQQINRTPLQSKSNINHCYSDSSHALKNPISRTSCEVGGRQPSLRANFAKGKLISELPKSVVAGV